MKNRSYPLYQVPHIRDLKDMLAQKKETQPEKLAFTFTRDRHRMVEKTYLDFYEEVRAFGAWMYRQDMKNMHIAIVGQNCYEWLLIFFAIVNGGNVAVPIDRELPSGEMAKLFEKGDVQAVFCTDAYRQTVETANTSGLRVYSMSKPEPLLALGRQILATGEREYPEYCIDREKLCCILFTSGTAGESKGVMLSHKNLAEDINGSCQLFVLEGHTLAILPFHHAFGLVVGILMVFHYGFSIHINKSLKTLQRGLQLAKPQTLFLVPLFVEAFHKQVWSLAKKEGKEKALKRLMGLSDLLLKMGIDIRGKCFAQVRSAFGGNLTYIICGGAPLEERYIREFRSWGIELLNGYGTTECSPCAAVNRNYFHRDGTVGQMIPGGEAKIAEDGEVLIRGSFVMLGYYKDEQATAEVLRDGWYATGDLGRIDKDGFLTLTGRKKNLIIFSNGENVSPEELEADFLREDGVQEVLVYERDGVIAAEIYPESGYLEWPGEEKQRYFEEVQKKINHNRPIYKQVGKVVLRDTEFPKNTSKKILRYKVMESKK